MAGLLALARISGLLVATLVLVWALSFRTTFLHPISVTSAAAIGVATSQLDHLYSVNLPTFLQIPLFPSEVFYSAAFLCFIFMFSGPPPPSHGHRLHPSQR